MTTTHKEEIARLKKVEGQIRGIIRMIENGRYCIDILLQLSAVRAALAKISKRILRDHMRGCVVQTFSGKNAKAKEEKIQEILDILEKLRRCA